MPESVFRTLFSASVLEAEVTALLKKWMPTYIKETERQMGLEIGLIPPPRYYTRRNEFTSFPDEQLPLCVVISPGIVGEPRKGGDGIYSCWWAVGIGIVAATSDEISTNQVCKIYGAAVRGILLHQQHLDGEISQGVEWDDERYDDNLPGTDQRRSLGAVREVFRIWVDDVVTALVGPSTPDPDDWPPGTEWGQVEHVIIEDPNDNLVVEVP